MFSGITFSGNVITGGSGNIIGVRGGGSVVNVDKASSAIVTSAPSTPVVINGHDYNVSTISVKNGRLEVKGDKLTDGDADILYKNLTIHINGPCTSVSSQNGTIIVNGNVDTVSSVNGNITVSGDARGRVSNVNGNVKISGSCSGRVGQFIP